ncbi:MAG TPA: hypothetical protein DCS07_05700 [Bdellovibrionales bacterium]|nr:MAG: hypothetical protein A2X97_10210 [Bdellovibrionales bacterium GWA1_52_35]HAR42113.1 hypothetical protein [Bdellovibrionales bacterium]HCM38714.1 hypothetical protein [Bdellovibrionales bacterium]
MLPELLPTIFKMNTTANPNPVWTHTWHTREGKPKGGSMGNVVRFYGFVLKVGILLALSGQLKSCTLTMLGLAARQPEIMSYSKFSRMLIAEETHHE